MLSFVPENETTQLSHQQTFEGWIDLFSSYSAVKTRQMTSLGWMEAGLTGTDFQGQSSFGPSILQSTFNSIQASCICVLLALGKFIIIIKRTK